MLGDDAYILLNGPTDRAVSPGRSAVLWARLAYAGGMAFSQAARLAKLFLKDNEPLMVAVILLGSSPGAMVRGWGKLAEGTQEQNVINTSLNTLWWSTTC